MSLANKSLSSGLIPAVMAVLFSLVDMFLSSFNVLRSSCVKNTVMFGESTMDLVPPVML